MSDWRAFIEDDDEGNVCIYLQKGSDTSTRELYEMVEHDVKDSLVGQEDDYLAEAQDEADSRNGDEELKSWVDLGRSFVDRMPAKAAKPASVKKKSPDESR